MSQAEINERLARFAGVINSDRETLRRKVGQLLRAFNGGESTIQYGPFSLDVMVQLGNRLDKLNDNQVSEILRILRE